MKTATWPHTQMLDGITPTLIAKHVTRSLPDGEAPVSNKELLNAIAYDVVIEEIKNMIMARRHPDS